MKKIVLGIPLVSKTVHSGFVKSIVESINASLDQDIQFFIDFESNEELFDMSLNVIANRVMNSETVDGVVFLSPNITWKPKTLNSLINSNKDVITGVFPEPVTVQETYNIKLLESQDVESPDLKAEFITFKSTYISKNALKKVSEVCPKAYDEKFVFFFMPGLDGGIYNPSYQTFCSRLREAEIDIYVEKTANFGNIGEVVFDGNYEKLTQMSWVNEQTHLDDIQKGILD